jgi:flagellin-like protein
MKMFKDTKAVSPVIGIMLMLVVTVILAAAVSSTSTGLMKSSDPAPFAVFEVDVAKNVYDQYMGARDMMSIKHITGDPIATSDMKIVTFNHEGVRQEILPGESVDYFTSDWAGFSWAGWNMTDTVAGVVPYWNNAGKDYFGDNPAVDFGNYTLRPGVVMTAQNYRTGIMDPYPDGYSDQMDVMFADWSNVSQGDFVTVRIIHSPSGSVIFDNKVMVR